MYMCSVPNSSKTVDKKDILRTVSNTGIYCSSDKVCTVYLVQYIFENFTANISALCSSCEDVLLVCTVNSEIALSRKHFGTGHMNIYTFA
jgi:hypothetical protein